MPGGRTELGNGQRRNGPVDDKGSRGKGDMVRIEDADGAGSGAWWHGDLHLTVAQYFDGRGACQPHPRVIQPGEPFAG